MTQCTDTALTMLLVRDGSLTRLQGLIGQWCLLEQVVVDAGSVLPVPSNWSTHEAASFMETTLTAYLTIFQIGGAAKGKSVLVHGGGSGIGT